MLLSVGLLNTTNFISKKVSKRSTLLLIVKFEGFHHRKAFCAVTQEGCDLSSKGFSRVTRWSPPFRVRISKIKSLRTAQLWGLDCEICSRGLLRVPTRNGRFLTWLSREVRGQRTQCPVSLGRRRKSIWFYSVYVSFELISRALFRVFRREPGVASSYEEVLKV